ncbi:MAG: hypothetical protein ACJ8BW_12070 [Ktedonobacteraceae bacterium]
MSRLYGEKDVGTPPLPVPARFPSGTGKQTAWCAQQGIRVGNWRERLGSSEAFHRGSRSRGYLQAGGVIRWREQAAVEEDPVAGVGGREEGTGTGTGRKWEMKMAGRNF